MKKSTLNSVPYDQIEEVYLSETKTDEFYVMVSTGHQIEIITADSHSKKQWITKIYNIAQPYEFKLYSLKDVTDFICCELPDGATTFTEEACCECQQFIESEIMLETDQEQMICNECNSGLEELAAHNEQVNQVQFGRL